MDNDKAISLSTADSQLLLAESLSQDILESSNINATEKEDKQLAKNKVNEVAEDETINNENIEQSEETSTENITVDNNSEEASVATNSVEETAENVETSALTEWDLRVKISEACEKVLDIWCWVAFHFPVDKIVWIEAGNRESELDYVLFTYEVNNDEVTVSEPQNVKLTVSVSEVNSKFENLQSEVSTKNDAIVKANEEIQTLKTQVNELTPFKEKFEEAEQKKIEEELAEKKKTFKTKYKKSNLISEDEFETSEEIKGFIETLNEDKMNALIASRYMASLEKETIETSETKETKNSTSASANLTDDDVAVDKVSVMKQFLRK
jgi:hypothetical protein